MRHAGMIASPVPIGIIPLPDRLTMI